MARRRRTNTAEDTFELFHDLFMHIPAWICLPVAAAIFVGLKLLITKVATGQLLLELMAARYGTWVAGFFALIVVFAGIMAAIKKKERRRLLDKQQGLDTIRALSWSEFELLVGEAYRRLGYQVTETGGGGADGGIDLKLKNSSGQTLLVQCKQWRIQKVGVKPVRELFGVSKAEGAAKGIFVTTGVYTQEARDFAKGNPIELVDGETLALLIAPIRGQSPSHSAADGIPPVSTEGSPTARYPQSCPVCHSAMVLRTARKGVNAGSEFWGCSDYPRCRGTRPA